MSAGCFSGWSGTGKWCIIPGKSAAGYLLLRSAGYSVRTDSSELCQCDLFPLWFDGCYGRQYSWFGPLHHANAGFPDWCMPVPRNLDFHHLPVRSNIGMSVYLLPDFLDSDGRSSLYLLSLCSQESFCKSRTSDILI